ncbi:MAG TPA: peptide chain release factor aRF-1 [Candidatus Nanoarchaeia archaeon]|nr:peptide chain release factor aRF-1 [Candidatus Nanoarchaeia archaeon]
MSKEDKKRQELEELVKLLGGIRGSHTELVTVLIPGGSNIHQVSTQLFAERSTAENIKSKATRTAVTDALDMIIRELKNYKLTPPNGLALFCGNVSEKEGNQDIRIWAIEPFKQLRVRIYRCDKEFVIEPLQEMLDVDEVYGLIVIDRQQATIGILEGKKIDVLRTIESSVPGKYKAGGQSAQRFERIREDMAKAFFKEVSEGVKNIFFDMPKLKGILIGGPMPTKDEFIRDGDLPVKLKEKIIATKDLGYTDEHGLKLLVEASQEEIAQQEMVKEKNLITKFFETLGKNPGKTTYTYEKTKIALERGAVDLLMISKNLPKNQAEELEKLANDAGTTVEFISLDNQDGEQFNNVTKGVGGILRFQIEFEH